MRDRLIEILKHRRHLETSELADVLIESGVIVPPCKVGATVYKVIADKRVKRPHECKVVGFWCSEDATCNNVHLVRYVKGAFGYSASVSFSDFGKTVFLTREEAERALEGGDG